jgi:hypothetical protein
MEIASERNISSSNDGDSKEARKQAVRQKLAKQQMEVLG